MNVVARTVVARRGVPASRASRVAPRASRLRLLKKNARREKNARKK